MRALRHGLWVGMLGLCACTESGIQTHVSQTTVDTELGQASLALRVSDDDGEEAEVAEVSVQRMTRGGDWEEAPSRRGNKRGAKLDVVLVADNSGSEGTSEQAIQDAALDFADTVLSKHSRTRAGLVRVSTEATVVSELTAKGKKLRKAADELFVSNGWTALYDGVRLANEVLERGVELRRRDQCETPVFRAIVVFSDGEDNNSADEHETRYEGDGIDTTLDDLLDLEVNGGGTPIFTVAVGSRVDEDSLFTMSDGTGGTFSTIEGYERLANALVRGADRIAGADMVCVDDVEPGQRVRMRVTAKTRDGNVTTDHEFDAPE